jgi:SAM-dependent methyltransferase
MGKKDAYNEALGSGQYQKPGGLLGKYDNVRRFWEDEQLGLYLRPYLEPLVDRRVASDERINILDLGCGSGDGFELITAINRNDAGRAESETKLITEANLGIYQGIDMNDGLLSQAASIYRGMNQLQFTCADINDCRETTVRSYDLYLANYGTLSHNKDKATVNLLTNITRRAAVGSLIVIDWLGRFSYEWQTLWTDDYARHQWIDYVISYIYAGGQSSSVKLTHFPLRIMGRREVQNIYRRVRQQTGGKLRIRRIADRSSLVGRHMNTAQYNPHCPPLRLLVNSLFEPNRTTNLHDLIISYHPREEFTAVDAYYRNLTNAWNYLVRCTQTLLEGSGCPEIPSGTPSVVRQAVATIKRIVRATGSIKMGNPRANLVEPQLGYCLREIESGLQKGLGCGHGLVAIFEVVK